MTLTATDLPATLDPGRQLLTVVTAGAPSVSRVVDVTCSLAIAAQPAGQLAAIGSSVEFSVSALGGRSYRWRRDGVAIPGASGPTYRTPPVTAGDSGAVHTVEVLARAGARPRPARWPTRGPRA